MIPRLILSGLALAAYGFFRNIYNPIATLATGKAAGGQFVTNDVTSIVSQLQMAAWSNVGVMGTAILVLILFMIWFSPAKNAIMKLGEDPGETKKPGTGTALALAIAIFGAQFFPAPAAAFFQQTEKTEAYSILPNQSAFWVPDTGDNKTDQSQLDSEAYYNERKISAKRFVIPHAKLGNTGGYMGWDYYVPTGRLYIVDRAPYSREWSDHSDKGTSSLKEGVKCQSREGLDVLTAISVGATVLPGNGAKFLYNFGVNPPKGDPTSGDVIFTSVYFGRSLSEVMDDNGRRMIHTFVCEEITKLGLDDVNLQANEIMTKVMVKTTTAFDKVGITLQFLGWADTFTFDKEVQDAINRRFISAQEAAIAQALAPYADTIQALAAAHALRKFGEHSDGKLPTTIMNLPTDVNSLLGATLGTGKIAAPKVPAPMVPGPK